jgi:thiosulfate reductase/polysulfide reductase chain A
MGGINGALCARGAAGKALINDNERIQQPMIRVGDRGQGNWKPISWDEALDYAASQLQGVIDKYGAKSILFSDRGGPFRDLHQAFMRGIGSPNWTNHDTSCARNVQHAALSLFGFGRKGVGYDLKNARHVVLQTRNIFEAINVKEVNDLMTAMENGCTLSVIDIRANIPATKAHRFMMIRPGSDYALNLAVIHTLLKNKLYNVAYVKKWIKDLDALDRFIQPYSAEWAEKETGIAADEIVRFAKDLAKDAPAVLWHPGWMNARYSDSFYMSRTIYIINSLLGSIGAKGGLPMVNKPSDVGRKGLKKLTALVDNPDEKRADGAGWREGHGHFDGGPGLLHLGFDAMETQDPYPVKAYIAYRHDPLMGYPDPERTKQKWANLDFLMSVSFTWSDTAWHSDLVLPLSPYLERESILACKNSLNPFYFIRKRAVQPRYDTKADWEILCGLAKRLGVDALAFDAIEDIWKYQLQGTGVELSDFDAKGFIPLADGPQYQPEPTFKTPSGKIEIISEKWESQGIPSLKPYEGSHPPEGKFRLTFGRCGVHTQGHTVNNPLLFEQVSENTLWINTKAGKDLGLSDGDMVEISGNGGGGQLKAKLTDLIHPEAVFMLHGFGHRLPVESRAFGKGVADHELMCGGLDKWDKGGGAMAMQEHYVAVTKA